MTLPGVALSSLSRADGSATYSAHGYTIIGAVNGPIEVQRRDELPNEATIEVNVRPSSGVGSTIERHLESIIHSTLRRVILINAMPRSLVQITLQIISLPELPQSKFSSSSLLVLPALLETAMLSLLSAALPLDTTYTSVLLGTDQDSIDKVVIWDQNIARRLTSLHVFAFSSSGGLLLSESEGYFTMDEWEAAHDRAKEICGGATPEEGLNLKQVVQDKIAKEQSWKS